MQLGRLRDHIGQRGIWDLAELEGWISGGEGGSSGTVSATGRQRGPGLCCRLGQGPWMEKWLGPRLAAARDIKTLGAAAGAALGQRLRASSDEDPLGPATASHGPLPHLPARTPKPATALRWMAQLAGTPHLGWCGSAASACPPRAFLSCCRRCHLHGGSACVSHGAPGTQC